MTELIFVSAIVGFVLGFISALWVTSQQKGKHTIEIEIGNKRVLDRGFESFEDMLSWLDSVDPNEFLER